MPSEIFAATAYLEARFSCYLHNFVHVTHLSNFLRESSLAMEKSLLMKKLNQKKVLDKKRKRKKKTRNKERVPFFRLVLAELHGGVQISNIEVAVKPKLVIHKFKKGFSFYIYASTSLDTKTLTIAPNRTFESCMSIRCLTSQHIFRFLHFYRVSPIGYLSRKIFIHCH